ncbi:MAG: glycogen/starch/alpha-glucan phosphorylase, partial [Acidobacteriaceae bacterium]|nr:glycogen/starch/alpha-glucan phosphorylase [Acidobacteriaceae bacterium]
KLANSVAETINRDPETRGKLTFLFLPNYRVSLAERIVAAADLSEQISTAGTEASGTGNMKFQLNGALTMGTLDGANIEILEEVGHENMFVFGKTSREVEEHRPFHNPWAVLAADAEIRQAIELIQNDFFSLREPGLFKPILQSLFEGGDRYLVLADLRSYVDAQERAGQAFRDTELWTRKAIINVARSGRFSADRTVAEYASEIWRVDACEIPPYSSHS